MGKEKARQHCNADEQRAVNSQVKPLSLYSQRRV